jgi:FkbM family methyltransferase
MKEFLAHHLIGTPLEGLAFQLRDLTHLPQHLKHPELKEIYVESARLQTAMTRIIRPSMNCIDIGAHLGSVLNLIQKLAPHGKHLAIEPIPYKAQWLKQKFPEIEVLQIALSDTVGEVDFFLQPHRSGFSGLRLHQSGKVVENAQVLRVNCKKLSDVVPADLSIGFIKIDVEGGELAVLKGGEAILKHRPVIVFECTQSGLQSYNLSPQEVYQFFEAHSYGIFLVKDWLANGTALSYEQLLQAIQYPFQAFNFLAVPNPDHPS